VTPEDGLSLRGIERTLGGSDSSAQKSTVSRRPILESAGARLPPGRRLYRITTADAIKGRDR
jgi:hypothetical protein